MVVFQAHDIAAFLAVEAAFEYAGRVEFGFGFCFIADDAGVFHATPSHSVQHRHAYAARISSRISLNR